MRVTKFFSLLGASAIVAQAQGGLPTIPLPATLNENAIKGLQVINWMTEVEKNLRSTNVKAVGYPDDQPMVLNKTLITAALDEQLSQLNQHAVTTLKLLEHYGANASSIAGPNGLPDLRACEVFSGLKYHHLVELLNRMAAVYIGTLSTLVSQAPELSPILSGMLAQKARAASFYQSAFGKSPTPNRFDPTLPYEWALNLVSPYIYKCSFTPSFDSKPRIRSTGFSSGDDSTNVGFEWKEATLDFDGPKPYVAWLSGSEAPIFTSFVRNGSHGGYTQIPNGIIPTAFVALTSDNHANSTEELKNITLSGPVLLDIPSAENWGTWDNDLDRDINPIITKRSVTVSEDTHPALHLIRIEGHSMDARAVFEYDKSTVPFNDSLACIAWNGSMCCPVTRQGPLCVKSDIPAHVHGDWSASLMVNDLCLSDHSADYCMIAGPVPVHAP